MALIQLTTGSVFLFSDGEIGIQQIAGTEDVFVRNIRNKLNFAPGSLCEIQPAATFYVEPRATFTLGRRYIGSPSIFYGFSEIDPTEIPTSSITTLNEYIATGSIISVNRNGDHMLRISNTSDLYGGVIKYIKPKDNTDLVTVRSTLAFGISGQQQWSSSDAYASIELFLLRQINTPRWIITSKVGNWY